MTDKQTLLDRVYVLKNKDEMVDLYRQWAQTYDDELDRNAYVAPEIGAAVFAQCVEDRSARIIDVGCGTGLVGGFLAADGYTNIDGLDISTEMLDQARDKGVYKDLFEADLTRTLDIPADSYDAAISVGTFTHSHIGPDRLDEVLRLVKPGGLACITVNGDSYLADDYGAKFDSMVADGMCTIYDEREEEYMIARNIKSRIVILKKG